MNRESGKVFVACALGAFIGALAALELNSYFWWLGLIVGGLVGYLTYEFKEVIEAVRQAWKAVVSWRISFDTIKKILRQFRYNILISLAVGEIFFTLGIGLSLLLIVSSPLKSKNPLLASGFLTACFSLYGFAASCLLCLMFSEKFTIKELQEVWVMVKIFNPFSTYC